MYVTAKNIKSTGISLDGITFVSRDIHAEIFSRCNPEEGDILYIKDGATTGIATINSLKEPFSMLSSVALLKPLKHIDNNYLLRFLQSPSCYNSTRNNMKGVGITRVTLTQMERWLVPFAPLEEQKSIGQQINNLFNLIENLENDKESLSNEVQSLKSKILNLAIRGKLVPQDPKDESASVLLERIKAKHPRSKKTASRTSDNSHYPFDIPENWIWVHGYECFNPMESKKPTGEIFLYIDIKSIDNKQHIISGAKSLKVSEAPSRASRGLAMGDTLFSMVRPYLENIAFVEEIYQDGIASTGFFVCKPNQMLYPKYLYYLMLSSYVIDGLNAFMKGDNSPSINNNNITSFLYPIPPMKEQKRIINKIEQISVFLDFVTEETKA